MPSPEVILETERLVLRPFRESDFPTFAAFSADEESTRYVGGTRDEEASWRVLATLCGHWDLRGYGPFALEEKKSGEFVGYCGPWFPRGKPEQELMWGIMQGARRKGFASEAARAARQWVYRERGWTGAVSYIHPENAGSRGVARSVGAKPDEGTIPYKSFHVQVWRHPGPDQVLSEISESHASPNLTNQGESKPCQS